jgi:hypothetical protein
MMQSMEGSSTFLGPTRLIIPPALKKSLGTESAEAEIPLWPHFASKSTSLIGRSQWASRISNRRCSSFLKVS